MDPKDFFNRDDKKSNSSAFRLNDTLNSHKNPKGHRIRRYLGSSVAVLTGILIVASPSVLTYTIPEMTKQMKEEYVKVINYVYQKKQPEIKEIWAYKHLFCSQNLLLYPEHTLKILPSFL